MIGTLSLILIYELQNTNIQILENSRVIAKANLFLQNNFTAAYTQKAMRLMYEIWDRYEVW